MDARQLILRHGEEAERVIGSQIRLGGEGKALEVREGAKIVGMGAVLVEFGAHRRDSVIGATQRGREPARLQSDDLVAGGRLDRIEQALVWRGAEPHADGPVDAGMSPPNPPYLSGASPMSQARAGAVKRNAGRAANPAIA